MFFIFMKTTSWRLSNVVAIDRYLLMLLTTSSLLKDYFEQRKEENSLTALFLRISKFLTTSRGKQIFKKIDSNFFSKINRIFPPDFFAKIVRIFSLIIEGTPKIKPARFLPKKQGEFSSFVKCLIKFCIPIHIIRTYFSIMAYSRLPWILLRNIVLNCCADI